MSRTLLIFGYGYIGAAFARLARDAGWRITATARSAEKRKALEAQDITVVDPVHTREISADAVLITVPPEDGGCPAFTLHTPAPDTCWTAYLSTTGVYGDRAGGWVWEDSELQPTSTEGRRRVLAEQQWQSVGAHIFRLPGLYGTGRNVIERLRDGTARLIHKPGHVFSRLHHDDCATALLASLNRPRPGAIYNLCDDEPAPADQVLRHAATLCDLPLPQETAWDDPRFPAMQRFYRDNKRVSNALAKAELGWQPHYPTYREGLFALWQAIQKPQSD